MTTNNIITNDISIEAINNSYK